MANQLNTASKWFGVRNVEDYEILNSALFASSSTGYLRLAQTTTNTFHKRKWTFSTWFRVASEIDSFRILLGAGSGTTERTFIALTGKGQIQYFSRSNNEGDSSDDDAANVITSEEFNDPTAWYHLVVNYDATRSTETERVKFYVNGRLLTNATGDGVDYGFDDFSTTSTPAGKYSVPQNRDSHIGKNGFSMDVGRAGYSAAYYFPSFHGYLADTYFIAGYNYDATYFGKFSWFSQNSYWTPIRLRGDLLEASDGDSFFLEYKNTSASGATASDVGADTSGNGNHFTPYGAWSGNGAVKDTPTNTFPVWNYASSGSSDNFLYYDGGRRIVKNGGNDWETATCTMHPIKNAYQQLFPGVSYAPRFIAEFYIVSGIGSSTTSGYAQGFGLASENSFPETYLGSNLYGINMFNNGNIFYNGGRNYVNGASRSYKDGDIVTVKYSNHSGGSSDLIEWYINGVRQYGWYFNNVSDNLPNGAHNQGNFSFAWTAWTAGIVIANFGQDSSFMGYKTRQYKTDDNGQGDFYYDYNSTSGANWGDNTQALCTKNHKELEYFNIPIDLRKGDTPRNHFDTVLYKGNGASSRNIEFSSFQPDYVYIKQSGINHDHEMWDSVRGIQREISFESSSQEFNSSGSLTAFNNDGFRIGSNTDVNTNNFSHYGYAWKAGGTSVTNNDGTVQSTVSANTKAGFSIIKYSGTSTQNFTIGHGLGLEPETFWIKNLDNIADWKVYHQKIGASRSLTFDSTSAGTGTYNGFNNTRPTSSVINLRYFQELGQSGDEYICYAFVSRPGFSKFHYYRGGESRFVWCGFKPAFLMIKNTTDLGAFRTWSNVQTLHGKPRSFPLTNDDQLQTEDGNFITGIRWYSNGFGLETNDSGYNTLGHTYVFWAWAEAPFHYGNAC
jgi:hypothetical protein